MPPQDMAPRQSAYLKLKERDEWQLLEGLSQPPRKQGFRRPRETSPPSTWRKGASAPLQTRDGDRHLDERASHTPSWATPPRLPTLRQTEHKDTQA